MRFEFRYYARAKYFFIDKMNSLSKLNDYSFYRLMANQQRILNEQRYIKNYLYYYR